MTIYNSARAAPAGVSAMVLPIDFDTLPQAKDDKSHFMNTLR